MDPRKHSPDQACSNVPAQSGVAFKAAIAFNPATALARSSHIAACRCLFTPEALKQPKVFMPGSRHSPRPWVLTVTWPYGKCWLLYCNGLSLASMFKQDFDISKSAHAEGCTRTMSLETPSAGSIGDLSGMCRKGPVRAKLLMQAACLAVKIMNQDPHKPG